MKSETRNFSKKRLTKHDREEAVLFSLIANYIASNHPIGSETLKASGGFEYLSAATIRNYFSKLEKEGFLIQSHASGGRIPTELAFRKYANAFLCSPKQLTESFKKTIDEALELKDRALSSYLTQSIETLSEWTKSSIFLSSPRFDQDFIYDVKLVPLEKRKLLCILITQFGLIRTETLLLPKSLTEKEIEGVQKFFLWKIGRYQEKPLLEKELTKIAHLCSHELLMRHIIGYAHFQTEEVQRAGLSKLLIYPEFSDPMVLAKNLMLFEDPTTLKSLMAECMKIRRLTLWIGSELASFSEDASACSILTIPYMIHDRVVGAIALLGPTRMDYPHLFALLTHFSKSLSQKLSEATSRYKISFRQPNFLKTPTSILLEDKTKS